VNQQHCARCRTLAVAAGTPAVALPGVDRSLPVHAADRDGRRRADDGNETVAASLRRDAGGGSLPPNRPGRSKTAKRLPDECRTLIARPCVSHPLLAGLLRSPFGRLFGGLCELRFLGRRSGRLIALPVQCSREKTQLVIYVGHAAGKKWWRNFADGRRVDVRVRGISIQGIGRVVGDEHADRAWAEQVYHRRFPRMQFAAGDPFVIIEGCTA